MAFSEKERKQLLGVLIVAAVGAAVAFWMYWRAPKTTQIADLNTEVESLESQVNAAKRALRRGTVEDLRAEVATYENSLALMRRLVPTENEVPDLLDNIASRARVRGVSLGNFERQPATPGSMFTTFRYRLTVTGYYDQIGEFLTDIASLPRIMVPSDVSLGPATGSTDPRAATDTTGSLLEASLQVHTYVKPQAGGASAN